MQRGVRRRLDFDSLPVEEQSRSVRRRLNESPAQSIELMESPVEPGIETMPEEVLQQIMSNMDQQTLGAFRRQSTRTARIGRPLQRVACMNRLMLTVQQPELRRELRTSMDQSAQALGALIKGFAMRVNRQMDLVGNTWTDDTIGYLNFEPGKGYVNDLANASNKRMRVVLKTDKNPAFGDVRAPPGMWWNAIVIFGPDESVYWNAFVAQRVHCHLQNRFAINPFLAQAVFVIEPQPALNTTMVLYNGLTLHTFPFIEPPLRDIEVLKLTYCALSLATLLYDELKFIDKTFFRDLFFAKLDEPIDMFGIQTDVIPMKLGVNYRPDPENILYLLDNNFGPRLMEGNMPEDVSVVLWEHSDLGAFVDEILPGLVYKSVRGTSQTLLVREPEDLMLELTRLGNDIDYEETRKALMYVYNARTTNVPNLTQPSILGYLKNTIENYQFPESSEE